jgi:hypothetical protein
VLFDAQQMDLSLPPFIKKAFNAIPGQSQPERVNRKTATTVLIMAMGRLSK